MVFMAATVVIVTGGGRGIGRAVCQRFGAEQAQVIAASRTAAELAETGRLVEQAGGTCHAQVTDVCDAEDVAGLVETAVERFGGVDVLVNCAGVAPLSTVEELDDRLFETILSVNVTAVYHACRAVWPVMRGRGGGVIVNVSSVSSVDPFPGFAAYGASKAWVNGWTTGLAAEGKPHGIRVYAVAPGAVETKMLRDAFPEFPADEALEPADVAEMVCVLSRPACRYASGQTIFVRR
jgi:NAD(P)-dependent dehydrogenase (short-subunit alcohol dehydrogenase family)